MSFCYRAFLRPLLFAQESEGIHNRTLGGLGWAARHPWACRVLRSFYGAPALPVDLFGLRFPNPVGLAAGMDKGAVAVPVWDALGFGFSELGGVTWHAQPGNPAPRMFRAIADRALVNRMGFNNPGARALAERLRLWRQSGRWPAHPVGINLGKSKVTPLEEAAGDYAGSFRELRELADFFVVNVSSPNTPNLRQLQDRSALDEILGALQAAQPPRPRPILVKVAPDLTREALDEILELATQRGLAGLIATNTTISRPETRDPGLARIYGETGGLSGAPLRARSTEVIRHLHRQSRGRMPIIGVGGILSVDDAWEKILAGASLLQIYSGMVYEGPALTRDLVRGIQQRLREAGCRSLDEVRGQAANA